MQLRALKPFPYANRKLEPGDEFSPRSLSDARILVAIGHAEAGEEAAREIEASIAPEPVRRSRGQRGPDKKPRKKRVYLRRDMQAEE